MSRKASKDETRSALAAKLQTTKPWGKILAERKTPRSIFADYGPPRSLDHGIERARAAGLRNPAPIARWIIKHSMATPDWLLEEIDAERALTQRVAERMEGGS